MSKEKEYLQDYDVKTEDVDIIEEEAKLNKDIIVEQTTTGKFSTTKEGVVGEVKKNEPVDLDEYFEK